MTLAQNLFALLAVLMLADLGSTVVGLRRGLVETNEAAWLFMLGLGPVGGAVAYQCLWLFLWIATVTLWPDQWAAPALGCVACGQAVIANLILLSKGTSNGRT